LFAVAHSQTQIHVYNFYTGDCPPSMQFIGHSQRVRCIDWFENDMGISTCGQDGNIYFYDLFTHSNDNGNKRNQEYDFNKRDVKLTSLVNVPSKSYQVFAVGSDGQITTNISVYGKNKPMP